MSNFCFNDENCITVQCECGHEYAGLVCDGTTVNTCPSCGKDTSVTCFLDDSDELDAEE